MLKRLVKLKDITNVITTKPTRIDGLSKKQINKLKSLDLTTNDWLNIDILLNIFEPFFEATKMLSGRKYATLSMSYVVEKILFKSLNTKSNNENKTETTVKKYISEKLKYHLLEKTNITKEQTKIRLVSKI